MRLSEHDGDDAHVSHVLKLHNSVLSSNNVLSIIVKYNEPGLRILIHRILANLLVNMHELTELPSSEHGTTAAISDLCDRIGMQTIVPRFDGANFLVSIGDLLPDEEEEEDANSNGAAEVATEPAEGPAMMEVTTQPKKRVKWTFKAVIETRCPSGLCYTPYVTLCFRCWEEL